MGCELRIIILTGLVYLNAGRCVAQGADNLSANQILRKELNYFGTALTSSKQTATQNYPSFLNHPGYSYITPGSTYNTYSPTPAATQSSQTAPLALSLYPDDYQNFQKNQETSFIPKTRNTAVLERKPNQEFYIPRDNVKQAKVELKDKAVNAQRGRNDVSLINEINNQAQHGWSPISVNEQPLNFPAPADPSLLPIRPIHLDESFVEQNAKNPFIVRFFKSNSMGDNNRESTTSTNCSPTSKFAQHREFPPVKPALAVSTNNIQNNHFSSQSSTLLPQSKHIFGIELRRLQILRALLGEYLSLTLQTTHQGFNTQQKSPNITPQAAKKTEVDPSLLETQLLDSSSANKPHLIYGAPYK